MPAFCMSVRVVLGFGEPEYQLTALRPWAMSNPVMPAPIMITCNGSDMAGLE